MHLIDDQVLHRRVQRMVEAPAPGDEKSDGHRQEHGHVPAAGGQHQLSLFGPRFRDEVENEQRDGDGDGDVEFVIRVFHIYGILCFLEQNSSLASTIASHRRDKGPSRPISGRTEKIPRKERYYPLKTTFFAENNSLSPKRHTSYLNPKKGLDGGKSMSIFARQNSHSTNPFQPP